jgi:hypothetical protein
MAHVPDLSDWSDKSDDVLNGRVPLQSGYPVQPQKSWPMFEPVRAVRWRISLPQRGQ